MVADTLTGKAVDNLFRHNGIGTNATNHLQARLVAVGAQLLTQEGNAVDFHTWHFQYGCQNLIPNQILFIHILNLYFLILYSFAKRFIRL